MRATASGVRMRLGRQRWIAALPLCLAFGACGDEPAPAPPPPQPVKILSVGGAGAGGSLEFPGEVSPAQNAEPAFEVSGKIIEYPVDEGKMIAAGDVIARLDPRDFEAEVDKARANLNKTATDLKRYRILYDKGVSPLTDLESAQRRHEVMQAEFQTAQKALEDAVLRAPFAGTVARKLVADFQNVEAKQPIVILQDETSLEIEVNVPESDFAGMTPGLTLEERNRRSRPEVIVSSIPDRSFPARIKEFATSADPTTRTFKATFAFAPPGDVTIRPGMTAKVVLHPAAEAARNAGLSVPARAVVTDESGAAFVWVVDPEAMTVRRAPVEVGEMNADHIAIRSGLAPGAQIAVSGVQQLRDGMEVRRFEP